MVLIIIASVPPVPLVPLVPSLVEGSLVEGLVTP